MFNVNCPLYITCTILHFNIVSYNNCIYKFSNTFYCEQRHFLQSYALQFNFYALIALQNREKHLQYILGTLISC